MKKWGIFFLLVLIHLSVAQKRVPFKKGVNLTNWFQASAPGEIHFRKFTLQDIQNIKSLGCDVIRLPINLHAMIKTDGSMQLDPLFFKLLDQVVDWCEAEQIYLILDNHSFNPSISTLPSIEDTLIPVWKQMAKHFKNRTQFICYEILNEPHGIADNIWGDIQGRVIDSIRTIDSSHYIIVGPANWNSYANLSKLPDYSDSLLIYTFHFYDPFIFTHQGASWTNPSLINLSGIPFPYSPTRMPALPQDLQGTWVESSFNNYSSEGTIGEVRRRIDIAYQFSVDRNVPVFCGEFGVYIPNSPENDRVFWYTIVRQYFEYRNIPWTMWDYKGGFGLFAKNSAEHFESDLNVPLLNALGLNVPPQKEPSTPVDSTGILFYDDYIGHDFANESWINGGFLNFYDSLDVANGEFCIHWGGCAQYSAIRFRFDQIHDLSYLVSHGAKLKLKCKASMPDVKIDVRFVDSKDSTLDHPWRMGTTIVFSGFQNPSGWNDFSIPLGLLEEKGSYDNGWFDPQGLFDWTRVEYFEIVAEHHSLQNLELWLDDIQVEFINPNGIDEGEHIPFSFEVKRVYPNPFNPTIYFEISAGSREELIFSIYDIMGRQVYKRFINLIPGENRISWDGTNLRGENVPSGIYFVRIGQKYLMRNFKVVLLR